MFSRGFTKQGVQFSRCPHCERKGLYTTKEDKVTCKYCHLTGDVSSLNPHRRGSPSMPIKEFTRD